MNRIEEIVAHKRIELADAKRSRPLGQLERRIRSRAPARGFREAITPAGRMGLIAEVKRASPSAGPIRSGADAAEMARIYAGAGAHAISVLTDARFFAGRLEDLAAVREAAPLPVLRKDFLLEEYQVVETAAAGADALLLIVAILEGPLLRRLLAMARDLSLEPLVEVHSEPEVEIAVEAGAGILGINNRDLATFQVDLRTTERLARRIPRDRVVVSESGIRSLADVEFVQRQGVHAILVGETLMGSPDPAAKIRELLGR